MSTYFVNPQTFDPPSVTDTVTVFTGPEVEPDTWEPTGRWVRFAADSNTTRDLLHHLAATADDDLEPAYCEVASYQVMGVFDSEPEAVTDIRRSLLARGVPADDLDRVLVNGGQVWDTAELQADFTVKGFQAPFVVVTRKADGVVGSLEFTHRPRFYFNWTEA